MINEFQRGLIHIERLNYGIVSLAPKVKEALQIQKFRPICLLNVSFKIITLALMARMSKVMSNLIAMNQTAFLKQRYIMEGVMVLHEALNSWYHTKRSGILFGF